MMAYLQNGQHPPLPATFVAAAAVVPNTASANAMTPRSLAFIVIPRLCGVAHPLRLNPTASSDLRVKGP